MRRDVFQAIADPTRRQIIHLLSGQRMRLNDVAGHFDMSRPAVSKHIRILAECELVSIRVEGRERYCQARPQKLKEVAAWVEQYEPFWTMKLSELKNFVENGSANQRTAKQKTPVTKRKK